MFSEIESNVSLPLESKSVVWRVIGEIESPLKERAGHDLVRRIVRERVSSPNQDDVSSQLSGWYESHGDKKWLKEDIRPPIGVLVLAGIGDALLCSNGIGDSDTAFWAVGSIEPDMASVIIRSLWSSVSIELFVSYVIKTLEKLCKSNAVIDPKRVAGFDVIDARVSMRDVQPRKMLEAFRDLNVYDLWLYPGVHNLITLLVRLNPDNFYTLVGRIDHLAIQAWAAYCVVNTPGHCEQHDPLRWITRGVPDALVALAIVHVVNKINELDSSLRGSADPQDGREAIDATASGLIVGLVDRLALVEPTASARWIMEVLSYAKFALIRDANGGKPRRIEQLEEACIQLLKHLVCRAWSEELLTELRVGLSSYPQKPPTLPLARVAWEVREVEPVRSTEIARLVVDTHELQILEALDGDGRLFYRLTEWSDDDWVAGLGIALALSCKHLDPLAWVAERCQGLPLSVWDVEDDHKGFLVADEVAKLRFLVAFRAILALRETGRLVESATVRSLAENLWAHCGFAGQHILGNSEGSDVAEYAARVAIELGEPSDVWMLEQFRRSGVDPRTLWALVDQRMIKESRVTATAVRYNEIVSAECRRVASGRFGDAVGLGLPALHYLASLWLLLGASDEAEQTAIAMMAFPPRLLNRADRVLALKLFSFAASQRKPAAAIESEMALLYKQLWPDLYTPAWEREAREQIDSLWR